MSMYTNTEGERIYIEKRMLREKLCFCLIIQDDPPPRGTNQMAPMLLDTGTVAWLLEELVKVMVPEIDGGAA